MLRPRMVNSVSGKTMQELHCSTVEKIEYLRRQGYNVVEIWECDVNRELEQNEDIKYYFDHYHIAESSECTLECMLCTAVELMQPNCTIAVKGASRSNTLTLPAYTPT